MRVLVIGARGFVGVDLTNELLRRGHSVVAVEPRPDRGRLEATGDTIEWRTGSCADLENVLSAIGPRGVDAIYYGPFYRSPSHERNLSAEFDVMGRGALQIFNLARVLGIRRIVFPSSTAVHGTQPEGETRLDEGSRVQPFGVYGATKLLCERFGQDVNAEIKRRAVVSLRLPSIYGPGAEVASRRVNVFPVQAARARVGRVDYIPETRVCIAHVQDIAAFIATVLEAEDPAHDLYEVGGLDVSFGDIAGATRSLIPDATFEFGNDTVSPLPSSISHDRARREFGLEHRDLVAGVQSIIDFERRRHAAAA